MAMLAAPRRRQKLSTDPRGLNWSNDENKFGQKLMEKMGWAKGKGLGANEDGRREHVKVDAKSDTRGVGCSKSYADNWIAHQDDFNSLLASLNTEEQEQPGDSKLQSLERKSKETKGRIHYQKFARGKDLSSAKGNDLDSIFGRRKSAPSTPLEQSEENSEESNDDDVGSSKTEHGVTTVATGTSVAEYFAKRMAEMKARTTGSLAADTPRQLTEDTVEKPTVAENVNPAPKKKKQRKDKLVTASEECSSEQNVELDIPVEVSKKKKKKKEKKCNEGEDIQVGQSLEECDASPGRKQKKKSKKNDVDVGNALESSPKCEVSKDKVKKKSKRKVDADHECAETGVSKKKKRGMDNDTEMDSQVENAPRYSESRLEEIPKSGGTGDDSSAESSKSSKRKKKQKDLVITQAETVVRNSEELTSSTETKETKKKKKKRNERNQQTLDSERTECLEGKKIDKTSSKTALTKSIATAFPGSNLEEIRGYGGGIDIGYSQKNKKKLCP